MNKNGYAAIGTSSGAISNSLGSEDEEQMPFAVLMIVVRRIAAHVKIPVCVDFDRGYTNDLNEIPVNFQKLIDAGVVGINVEDSQGEELYLNSCIA